MSQQSIRQRAANIRQTWSRGERRQRAIASDRRCVDLLVRLVVGVDRHGTKWHGKTTA